MFTSKWFQKLFPANSQRPRRGRSFQPALERLEERRVLSVALKLTVAPSSTYGVNNSLVIEYTNTGTSAAPAPVVILSADNANLWLPNDPAISGPNLQLLATGPSGPAGTLAPGAQGSIVVDFTSTSSTASAVNFKLGQLTPGQTINWAALQSSLQPSTIPNNAWPAVFANFTANVGSTTDSYQATLDADASYLAQIGEPTNDVGRLLAYEINKASDTFSTAPLGGTTDAGLPTPGKLSLSFERWFLPGVSGRYQMGTLGLGWTNNWAITARPDSSGNVMVNESGALRLFSLEKDGSYLGTWGDNGVLTKLSGGGYQLTEKDGSSTAFNVDGTLAYVQDTNGNRITAYYANGLLSQLTASANGSSLSFTYTNGLLTKVTDSTLRSTTYAYDAAGQHLQNVTDEGGTTSYSYVTGQGPASESALASITFTDNTHSYFVYDSQGRLIDTHQDNNQEDVQLSYGAGGGTTSTDALRHQGTVLMDDNGQVRETIDRLGNVTHYTYDLTGNLTAVNGPQGSNYVYTYDLKGNLLSTTDPLGLTTQFSYNAGNNLASYTDARHQTTSYQYDSKHNLLSITYADPDLTREQYNNYNPLGQASQFVNANGSPIGLTYDLSGQVKTESFTDGTSYSYNYDSRGNLLSATDRQGHAITFTYGGDPNNPSNPDLLTKVTYADGTSLKFSYYAGGQRMQSVDQTGFTVKYTYDAVGRLSQLTDGSGKLIVQYTFDVAGQLIQKDMGNGTRTLYTYDAAGQVLSIANLAPDHVTINSFDQYTYDALGNVLTDTNQDGAWSYTYDADNQLVGAVFTPNSSNPDGLTAQNIKYVYDAAGNRISQTVNGVTTTYVVNTVNEYTSSTTNGVTTNYGYDKDGNLTIQTTGSSTTNFTYDTLDQLIGVNGPGQAASYTFDALGNRNSQTVNGLTTRFQIGPDGLAATYDGSGNLIAHYTQGYGLTSQVTAGGSVAYYDFNLTGSTTGITSSAGSYVNKYAYQPFGQTTTIAASLTNPFTFVGQFGVMQDGSSLFHMGARTYSPVTAQFLSNDPLGLNGGDSNVRRYVANNPVSGIDPTGTQEASSNTNPVVNFCVQCWNVFWNGVSWLGNLLGKFNPFAKHAEADDVSHMRANAKQSDDGIMQDRNKEIYTRDETQEAADDPGTIPVAPSTSPGLEPVPGWMGPFPSPQSPTGNFWMTPDRLRTSYTQPEPIPVPQKLKNPNQQKLIKVSPNDLYLDLLPWVEPVELDTTVNAQPLAPSSQVVEGNTATVYVGHFSWKVNSNLVGPYTTSDVSATSVFQDGVQTTDTVVQDPNDPYTFDFYATRLFPEAADLHVDTSWYDYKLNQPGPGDDTDVPVAEANVELTPTNFTEVAGGVYTGELATFRDENPYAQASEFHVSAGIGNNYATDLSVQSNGGGEFTLYGRMDFHGYPPGQYSVYVQAGEVQPAYGTGYDTVTLTAPGAPQYTTSVSGVLLHKNPSESGDPPLAIIDTTDPTITSASQVQVSVGSRANANTPVPLITGIIVTPLPGGTTQIEVDGVISAVQPGAGIVTAAPLTITLGNEPALTCQMVLDETPSTYTVNPLVLNPVVGQPLVNVPVAMLAGPVNGSYTATIDWGDGDTSTGVITALGGDLFRVSGSKPKPYGASGTATITVTVTGPGDIPAPAAQTTAAVLPATAPGGGTIAVTVLDLTATAGASFSGTVAKFTDADTSLTAASFTATITWGNGQTTSGTVSWANGSFTVSGSSSYAQEGRYALAVTVSAADGSKQSGTGLAHVARVGPPPAQLDGVALALTTSTEYYSNFVTSAYQTYLHRAPDGPGLAGWVQGMKAGLVTDEQLEAFFIGSPEYIAGKGAGPGYWAPWVQSMYQDLLGRTPSQAEAQQWVDGLNAGISTTFVAHGFAASAERETDRVAADYLKYLGRAPSSAEVAGWVNAFVQGLATNEYVIAGFVGSAEYFEKHYGDAVDWLFSAYHAALGRDPGPGDMQSWLPYLQNS